MRVLFVTEELGDEVGTGGIGAYTTIAAEGLAGRGHDVHVLLCRAGAEPSDKTVRGVHIHRRPTLRWRGIRWLAPGRETELRLLTALSVLRYWRELAPFDVVEVPEWGAPGLLLALFGAEPVVTHLHTPVGLLNHFAGGSRSPDVARADRLERLAARLADGRSAGSHLLVDELLRQGWLRARTPVEVVPLPIDVDRWHDVRPVASTEPVVLAVGRIEERKSPLPLLGAIARLREEGCEASAVLVGRSSGSQPFRDEVDAAVADGRCTLAGEVPRAEMATWYGRARVVVVPSTFESFSVVATEAMAAGRPVVVTDRVGAAELLPASSDVVPVGSVEELARALEPYLRDPEVARQQGDTLRRVVRWRCSVATTSEQRERTYASAARSWRRRRGRMLRAAAARRASRWLRLLERTLTDV
jgi:glycogen synthase